MFAFDHLAVACETLEDGVAAVEAALGQPLGLGGQHPHFGTHNRLLSLGPEEYLEVIGIDPAAPPPGRSRWFGLDRFAGAPRLTNWILRCDDLAVARDRLGAGIGAPVALSRGNFRWSMAVPEDGLLPFDNVHPAMIRWESTHPARHLSDSGCRLRELVVSHPQAAVLEARLALDDPRIRMVSGMPGLSATIDTPRGPRRLC